jgi:hypothetical protein
MHSARNRRLVAPTWLACIALAGLAGCAGNQYGYARQYSPLGDEEPYYEKAEGPGNDVTYEDVRRDPQTYANRMLGWFGVVAGAKRLPTGEVQIALDLRFHQPRHLCTDQFESSCKVTISNRVGGPFTTTLRLHPEDESGAERLNVGSLVRIYGAPNNEFDSRGGPVFKTQFYRHWPHGAYVTTSGANAMRR